MTTPRVLVVDDDPGTLDTCAAVLQRAGYEVLKAESRVGGLDTLRQRGCDLLLADVRLPDGTGLDVLRELREGGSELPVVIMTGYPIIETDHGLVDTATEAARLGAAAYLEKPVFDEPLVEVLRRALAGRHREARVHANGYAGWAAAVAAVLDAPHDPRTLNDWSRIVGVASDTLRGWCRTVAVSSKRSLDLARVLRAVKHARRQGAAPRDFLRIADRRTLRRLLVESDLTRGAAIPSLNELLSRQTFVTNPIMIDELRATLVERGVDPEA
jgi:CheY-like chemotaxis protein